MSRLDRVAVAIDTPDRARLAELCAFFGPRVGVLKIGLEAYSRWGPAAVEEARRHARAVFLDLKLHDIPNTVAGAVRAVADLGADYLTVHAAGGPPMLEAAVAAAGEVRLLAVTVLTHLDAATLERLGMPGPAAERAVAWAEMARRAGCAGAVCSPHEVADLRSRLAPPFALVTPGIRFGAAVGGDDQRRVATPRRALADGASLLVIGRPLTAAADPAAALAALAESLGGASNAAPR